MDPLAEKFPSHSVYSYVGNNPLVNIDPNGMDWYRDSMGVTRFDPNVKENNTPTGCTWLGIGFVGLSQNGTARYRTDGSIFFASETDAYQRMNMVADRETFCVLTERGASILPDYKNTINNCSASLNDFDYEISEGLLFDPLGGLPTTAVSTVHTHPDRRLMAEPNSDDGSMAGHLMFGKTNFVLAHDQQVYAFASEDHPCPRLGMRYLTRVLPIPHVSTSTLLSGFSLLNYARTTTLRAR